MIFQPANVVGLCKCWWLRCCQHQTNRCSPELWIHLVNMSLPHHRGFQLEAQAALAQPPVRHAWAKLRCHFVAYPCISLWWVAWWCEPDQVHVNPWCCQPSMITMGPTATSDLLPVYRITWMRLIGAVLLSFASISLARISCSLSSRLCWHGKVSSFCQRGSPDYSKGTCECSEVTEHGVSSIAVWYLLKICTQTKILH